ncbi:DNA cytosine methyltransferase [Gemmatimonadota bacterium]
MDTSSNIPVVDLFAGPGGLGEGFAAYQSSQGDRPFRVTLSVEKETTAHQTLKLRSLYRKLTDKARNNYFAALSSSLPQKQQIASLYEQFPREAEAADSEAWQAELGAVHDSEVSARIAGSIGKAKQWVLVGGPPCQAYSLAGRSRNKGVTDYRPENDKRHFLYVEFLKAVVNNQPDVFVLENVKGLLSATVNNQYILQRMLEDLESPAAAIEENNRSISLLRNNPRYRIVSLSDLNMFNKELKHYLVRMENYGIPQARHRLILVGIRDDYSTVPIGKLRDTGRVTTGEVLSGLPVIRSGLSKCRDSSNNWLEALRQIRTSSWLRNLKNTDLSLAETILNTLDALVVPYHERGDEFIQYSPDINYRRDWYLDKRIGGVLNHSTRAHIVSDLHRYLFAACYTEVYGGTSPKLRDFPVELWPDHKNVRKTLSGGYFGDRFRVQSSINPAKTITSHISKDGHYYIHYDPHQCRSLTVREAARIQTFPDNYFFCGPRTSQYHQVGNAVPPLLAYQIAETVHEFLKNTGSGN